MLRGFVEILNTIESDHGIKCVHNEINILSILLECGPVPSLEIYAKSRRSLAGHNSDLRRLVSNGWIQVSNGTTDKRERLYELTDLGKEILNQQAKALGRLCGQKGRSVRPSGDGVQ